MEREFVDYTEALALKELGFNEPCFGYYDHQIKELDTISSEVCERLCKHDTHIKAPTYSQAFRFFRENHKLFGEVNICTYFIYDMSNNDGFHTTLEMVKQYDKLCDNYEEAELAALKQLIQIVKEK